jgi:hypothetical protein
MKNSNDNFDMWFKDSLVDFISNLLRQRIDTKPNSFEEEMNVLQGDNYIFT